MTKKLVLFILSVILTIGVGVGSGIGIYYLAKVNFLLDVFVTIFCLLVFLVCIFINVKTYSLMKEKISNQKDYKKGYYSLPSEFTSKYYDEYFASLKYQKKDLSLDGNKATFYKNKEDVSFIFVEANNATDLFRLNNAVENAIGRDGNIIKVVVVLCGMKNLSGSYDEAYILNNVYNISAYRMYVCLDNVHRYLYVGFHKDTLTLDFPNLGLVALKNLYKWED